MKKAFRITVCASGAGSNFASILKACRSGRLSSKIVLFLSSKPDTPAVALARAEQVPLHVHSSKDFSDEKSWDLSMAEVLKKHKTDLVILTGFLRKIGPATLQAFPGQILNLHPSLLPRYGGPGMYGSRVHMAVIAAGERETGITVHSIDQHYDKGEILAQIRVPILENDTAESLERRLKQRENEFIVEFIEGLEKSI